MYSVRIDRQQCEGCGECIDTCPVSILGMLDGKAEVTGDREDCLGCESCVSVCPAEAITVSQ